MIIITDATDAELPPDAGVRQLLRLRCHQLAGDVEGTARFIVADVGDSVSDLEAAIGFPITDEGEPCFEWITDHGGVYELAFILSDDGPAQVLLVPEGQGMDAELIALCRHFAGDSADLPPSTDDGEGARIA